MLVRYLPETGPDVGTLLLLADGGLYLPCQRDGSAFDWGQLDFLSYRLIKRLQAAVALAGVAARLDPRKIIVGLIPADDTTDNLGLYPEDQLNEFAGWLRQRAYSHPDKRFDVVLPPMSDHDYWRHYAHLKFLPDTCYVWKHRTTSGDNRATN